MGIELPKFEGGCGVLVDALGSVVDSEDFGDARLEQVLEWVATGAEQAPALAREVVQEVAERVEKNAWKSRDLWAKSVGVSLEHESAAGVLLLTNSVFEPEAWSKTFLEGLLRVPRREWTGRNVVELGTGSGWISLVLCQLTDVKHVYAMDINPHAVLVARVNLAIHSNLRDGPSPRVHVLHSDLLRTLLDKPPRDRPRVDAVVGCIPQVLRTAASSSQREELYDLGNYCALRGVLEDRFGLGLNAAALEQSLELLANADAARIVLNLADRPGRAAVDRMFASRGLRTKTLWQDRISQAADTDVGALVALERDTRSDFEFFLHRHSRSSVSARTAARVLVERAAAAAQNKATAGIATSANVWHGLRVVMAEPTLGPTSLQLMTRLRAIGAASTADLTYVGDEHAQFVLRLLENGGGVAAANNANNAAATAATTTGATTTAATTSSGLLEQHAGGASQLGGSLFLRSKVAAYVTRFVGRGVAPGDVFVGPQRTVTYRTLALSLRQSSIKSEAGVWLVNTAARGVVEPATEPLLDVIYGPDSVSEMAELVSLLRPATVVYALPAGGARGDAEQLHVLVTACEALGTPLILDGSSTFRITSGTGIGGGISALAEHPLGAYPIYLLALERSDAYPGMALTLIIHPREAALHRGMAAAALVTHATLPAVPAAYYGWLFDDMTLFRIWERTDHETDAFQRRRSKSLPRQLVPEGMLSRSEALDAIVNLGEASSDCSPAELVLHSELGLAPPVTSALIPALLAAGEATPQAALADETAACSAILDMLDATRTAPAPPSSAAHAESEVLLADSAVLMLQHITHALCDRHGGVAPRVGTPQGSSPALAVLAAALGLEFEQIASGNSRDGWKLTPSALSSWISSTESFGAALVVLSAPVSATGSVYTQAELDELVAVVNAEQTQNTYIVADESLALFAAASGNGGDPSALAADFSRVPSVLSSPVKNPQRSNVLAIGSFALELAAPGFQTSWCVSSNAQLMQIVKSFRLETPLSFVMQMIAKLAGDCARMYASTITPSSSSPSPLAAFWLDQRSKLRSNRSLCKEQLRHLGKIIECESGGRDCGGALISVLIETNSAEQVKAIVESASELGVRTRSVANTNTVAVFLLQQPAFLCEKLPVLANTLK